MSPNEIRAHLVATGWQLAHSQHYVSDMNVKSATGVTKRRIRIKFNVRTLTIECKSSVGAGWFRIGGDDYDNIRQEPDGRIRVITFFLPAKGSP